METIDENSTRNIINDPMEFEMQHDDEQYARVFGAKRAAPNKENGKKSHFSSCTFF